MRPLQRLSLVLLVLAVCLQILAAAAMRSRLHEASVRLQVCNEERAAQH